MESFGLSWTETGNLRLYEVRVLTEVLEERARHQAARERLK